MSKRLFDLVLATCALALLSPVLLVAALWVKLDSPGPVIFRHERVGWRGRHFSVLKLRTMRAGAPASGAGNSTITVGADERITRAGRVLRKWKVDELPQLVNVFKGDMSLVGPRPEVPGYVALYPPELRDLVQSVRPGLTDLASIAYRHESDLLARAADPQAHYRQVVMPAKLKLCAEYVEQQSLWLDIQILWRTVVAVFESSASSR